jgi:hypothetical protein
MQIVDMVVTGLSAGAGGVLLGFVKVGRLVLRIVRWAFLVLLAAIVWRVLGS